LCCSTNSDTLGIRISLIIPSFMYFVLQKGAILQFSSSCAFRPISISFHQFFLVSLTHYHKQLLV
jgi:hypothetical protein